MTLIHAYHVRFWALFAVIMRWWLLLCVMLSLHMAAKRTWMGKFSITVFILVATKDEWRQDDETHSLSGTSVRNEFEVSSFSDIALRPWHQCAFSNHSSRGNLWWNLRNANLLSQMVSDSTLTTFYKGHVSVGCCTFGTSWYI